MSATRRRQQLRVMKVPGMIRDGSIGHTGGIADVMDTRWRRCPGYMEVCFCLLKARISCVLTGVKAPLTVRTRLTEAGRALRSGLADLARPARGYWEGIDAAKSRYQH